jgi:hypothetical protein
MSFGAVRLAVYWEGERGGPAYLERAGDFWLAWSLAPSGRVVRKISVRAPNIAGPVRLCFGLVQVGYGTFSNRGILPICEDMVLTGGNRRPHEFLAVEWRGGYGPTELAEGSEASYRVGVRNLTKAWSGTVSVSYHWVRLDGLNGKYEGIRSPLPRGWEGERPVWIEARVLASVPPGLYGLLFDVVQEGSAWASNEGSAPMMVTVRVTPHERRPVRNDRY